MSRYPRLPEEGKEALKEHALGKYLPLTGGLYQNYGIRNFGNKKKPKTGVKFYAVEYRPHRIWLHKSPIYFDSEKRLKKFIEINEEIPTIIFISGEQIEDLSFTDIKK